MTPDPQQLVFMDNAATSWPKPACVAEAMVRYLTEVGASPGRGGYRLALEAERIRYDAREAVARLFGVRDPLRVVFTLNATAALNLVLYGMLPPGAHVITTGIEHNAVMRPLRALERQGVEISVMPCQGDGALDPAALDGLPGLIRPQTRLIVVNHASNVCGSILPVREIGAVARAKGVPLLVDAAQTGGCIPIDMAGDNIDLLAFSGHKGLLGPTGLGGLVLREDFDSGRLPPMVRGGTGSRSEHEEQPEFLPDKYESGTSNVVGLAGLAASVRYVLDRTVDSIRAHERASTQRLIDGLRNVPGVRVFGTGSADRQTSAVSITLAGWSPSEATYILDNQFGIQCRPGLHCSPRAHRTLGTLPDGTVRLAPGLFSTENDVAYVIDAVAQLAREEKSRA